jgi:hypothetical protein
MNNIKLSRHEFFYMKAQTGKYFIMRPAGEVAFNHPA